MSDEEPTAPSLRWLLGYDDGEEPEAPAPVKRKPGRPHGSKVKTGLPAPKDFNEALSRCSETEQQFVRAVVSGASKADAYLVSSPTAKKTSAAVAGHDLSLRHHVKVAVEIGKRESAQAVVLATKHDVQASFTELGELLEEARRAKQYTAAAKLAELRARLTGALVDRVESKQVGGFVFRVEGLPAPGRVIEVKPEGQADG